MKMKKKKKKKQHMVVTNTKLNQKMKNKCLLSIEKNIKSEKTPHYNCKKSFLFRKSTIILKSKDEEQIQAKYQNGFLRKQF